MRGGLRFGRMKRAAILLVARMCVDCEIRFLIYDL